MSNICEEEYERDRKVFINEFAKALDSGRGALFAGAGLSIPSGGISWAEILKEDAANIGLDVKQEHDLISVAQYIYNETGSRQSITQLLKNKIETDGKLNPNHEIISKLPISKVWTTNYDYYIEEGFRNAKKIVDIKHSVHDMSSETQHADVTIYKMHGDIGYPHDTVLLKDDYEIYDKKNEVFTKKLETDLLTNTFLFIGFSFDDPNLEKILSKVRIMLEGNPRQHYCILKRVSEDDPEIKSIENDEERKKALRYRSIRQQLRVKDLKRYGIKAILISEYREITDLLNQVNRKYLSNKVFISGAYHEVSNFLGKTGKEAQKEAQKFTKKLSFKLFKEGFEITTGLGLGFGMDVISGALNEELKNGNYILSNKLHVRPFPQYEDDIPESEVKNHYYSYREQIMKDSGISLFLFGNKIKQGNLVSSDGIKDEHEIAKNLGHFRLPIVNTGYVSEELWGEYEGVWQEYIKEDNIVEKIEKLSQEKKLEKLVSDIVSILKAYKKNPEIFNDVKRKGE